MKGRIRTPLWLICDVSAALRLALATWLLTWCLRRYWPRTRPPTRTGAASLSLALSYAEALVRWAILRQAMRSCGLDPRAVPIIQLSLATNALSWRARCRVFIRLAGNMTVYARRWASRIRELSSKLDDDDDFGIGSSTILNPTILGIPLWTIPATTIF